MVKINCSEYITIVMVAFSLAWALLWFLFIPGIVVSSKAASSYIKERQIRESFTHISCRLLNYTSTSHQCRNCNSDSCSTNKCFDEEFFVLYSISNGTLVTSRLVGND